MTIAIALVLALAGFGCGGGDDTASDTDTVVTETTDDTTTDTTDETTDSTDETDGDGSFATEDCTELATATAAFSQAFSTSTFGEDVDDTSEIFDDFAESAPEEIRDDIRILAEAYAEYADVLADADIDPGEVPDAAAIAALQAALARIDQEGVTEASANVSAWATANC
jgi:hypothetical protein